MTVYDYDAIFDLLLKNASTCELMVDMKGNVIRVNDAYQNLIGYSEAEIKTDPTRLYPSEDAINRDNNHIKKLLSGVESDIKYESERNKKNGEKIPVEVNATLFRDSNGKPDFVIKRIKDISERLQSEQYNKTQISFLQTLLNEIPINIYFKDLESRFLLMSKNTVASLRCHSVEEIIGKTDFDFFDKKDAQFFLEEEQKIILTGKPIIQEHTEVHSNNDVSYNISIKSPYKNDEGKIIGTFGISQDITELKQAQKRTQLFNEELEKKNQKLEETIVELAKTQNKLIFAEKMAALGALIGGVAHEINTPLGAIKASSSNISEVVEKINVDLPWLFKNASSEEINWLFKIINQTDARDISVFSREERQQKRQLTAFFEANNIQNAANIADTIVSLRINEPNEKLLQLLSLPHAQKLLQVLKVIFSLKRNTNNIYVSVEKAATIVKALKNYIYKTPSGEFEATDISETIQTVLILTANLLKQHKIEVELELQNIPLVYCRQDELCQVWTNIITNAIQAMRENGTLKICIKSKDTETVLISFQDTGGGIPEEIKDYVFTPYFTTKAKGKGKGIGMGLDLAMQIVTNHKGKIYFETQAGIGTTFFIEIPVNSTEVLGLN